MNKTSLINKLNKLTLQYPKNENESNNTDNIRNHKNAIYQITCNITDLWFSNLITRKTVRNYGKILRQYEYYPDEAGLGHFSIFKGI